MYRWEMISPNKVVVRCTSDNNSNAGSRLRRELDFVHRLFSPFVSVVFFCRDMPVYERSTLKLIYATHC